MSRFGKQTRTWLFGIIPVLLLVVIVGAIAKFGTGIEEQQAAPIEVLNIERIVIEDDGFNVRVLNSGPKEVTIAQVVVDAAFWNAEFDRVQRCSGWRARRYTYRTLGLREIRMRLN